jgi:preprotein translocase subunit YajC
MIGDWLTPVAWAQDGAGATAPAGGGLFSIVVMFVAIAGIWYLFMIRPQQKRDTQRREMIAALRKGDTIVTAGGIHARVYAVEDELVTLELGRDVRFKCDKAAIVGRVGDNPKEGAKS